MQALAKKNPRNNKIQPLDWKEASQSPALKGMVSFLEISQETIHRGANYSTLPTLRPVDTSSPGDTLSIVHLSLPVDMALPVDIASPMDDPAPMDDMSPMEDTSTGDVSSPIDEVSTGQNVAVRQTPGMVVGEVPTLNRRIIRCRLAQDAHTSAEESLYKVLWEDTTPADRTVRIGYAELASRTRLSRKTVGRLLQSLKAKLAIETLDEHRSMELVPKNYRIYSYKEILDRRREAGMEYVIRMNGILFVTAAGIPLNGAGKQGTESPVDDLSPGDNSSTGDIQIISGQLNRFWTVDEGAASQLLRSCRSLRPDATAEEIAFFVQEKVALVHANRSITNPTGFVLATVPQCFAGETFLRFRARRNENLRIAAEEAERQGREVAELKEWFRHRAESVLADPASSAAQRREAEKDLKDHA